MKTVRQLLKEKTRPGIFSVAPNATVYQALQLMAEKDIGAVLVVDQDKLVGIFSERDYARKVVLQGKTSAGTPIADIMTRKVVYVRPEQTVEDCMAIMGDKRIRHLPVMENEALIGVLSVTDLVRETIAEKEFLIQQLENYIHQ